MAILRIKEVMKEKGIGRNDLAEKVGVSPTSITNITNEKNYPSFPLLVQIAGELDVDVRELLIPTKESGPTASEVEKARELIQSGLELLK